MGRKMIDLTGQNINGIIVHSPVEEQGGAENISDGTVLVQYVMKYLLLLLST